VILLIGIDTLRADHLGAYGYFRDTTPQLDAWITRQGAVLEQATSEASWTFPANASVHTGRAAFRNGPTWNPHNNPVPPQATTLAEYLQREGYRTAGFVSNFFVSRWMGLSQGFDHFDDSLVAYPHEDPGAAGALTDQVIQWTSQVSPTAPLFLFTWYLDPHTWYNPPPPYDLLYDPVYTGTLTPAAYGDGNWTAVETRRDFQHLMALYDGEISYTDEQIGRLLAYLDGRGLLDNALIIVYADHGELFGEHNKWVHGNTVYEELLRVPLLVRYTGVITAGQALTAPVQTMDILPTVLDYTGLPIPPELDGVSLRPLLAGQLPAEPRPIVAELDGIRDPEHWAYGLAPLFDLRALRLGDWKYIAHLDDPAGDELFRLEPTSSYERENLIAVEPLRGRQMRAQAETWYRVYRALLPAVTSGAPP
jgi:arylsulfatase A-like enzyme